MEHATVESVFQASKVFKSAGPFPEFLCMPGREIKRDPRLRNSGPLLRFELGGQTYPISPTTAFYDWVYLNALTQNPKLSGEMMLYSAFSDIAYNPKRSINCQARSAAMYLALHESGRLPDALKSFDAFIQLYEGQTGAQPKLPFNSPQT